jgi:hypothetical protein
MKKSKMKSLGFLLAALFILAGNLIGIHALANEDGGSLNMTGTDDPPAGVLVGYMPTQEKIRSGEHLEYFGWVGAPFSRLVNDYTYVQCCKRTYRAMDGCKGLKVCGTEQ